MTPTDHTSEENEKEEKSVGNGDNISRGGTSYERTHKSVQTHCRVYTLTCLASVVLFALSERERGRREVDE